ncbi:pyridoxal-phosphate dependent enzyme [Halorubrum sp. GN11_10-6_MGM]|uniref:pyridoxal-phosphate dependent enzyme n=1 Tax=Halorubrum sp. GN11_10-6_MGM TaxID=2518112 RepID=UPI0010F82BFD|nr:pyridoxal-phosphate dependent enzyme [Halorubrum sp. GN11_10-6_MGM]TKX75608.1 pyridoxal-phosphate dependent enzyme [Halorubrum sp. GN11_10-6_MGM]
MADPDDRGRGAGTSEAGSDLRALRCPECGETYRDRWRCRCGAPLDFAEGAVPSGAAPDPAAFDVRAGLWAFDDLLAVGDAPRDRVTLGEGMTPLVDADTGRGPIGDAEPEIPPWNASFKLEYVFPTGSFKDRGATTTLTRARELGVERVVEDSSGNAGAAIATYAARAGVDAEIYVPADAKESKLRAIRRAGAEPVRIEGSRQDVTDACVSAVVGGDSGATAAEDGDGSSAWYASHAWNPAFFEGTATVAYEIALQRDWEAPDAVVTPLGHGTLFLGAYRGFRRLERAGWIDEMPRLYGAQAAGVAPIVEALHGPEAADPAGAVNDAADGIQIAEPVRNREIREAIDATGGDALAVTEAAATRELDRLHAAGFYTEPTCAVAPAALRTLRDRGEIGPDEAVVVPLTGSGLKG